jgi:molybdopterin-dependent oxidoreductase alpha subunit
MTKRKVTYVPVDDFNPKFKLTSPKTKAVGVDAITSTMHHLADEIGLAKGLKLISKMNQKGGFDCSGCAWPDPDGHRSALGEYCENGAKALAEEATSKRVDENFFTTHSIEEISTWSDYKIGKSGRVIHPMYLGKGSSHYKKISWNQAFELIGKKFNEIQHPDEVVFYTSGRTSNEAAFLYQLLARAWGTNNLPDCSNMCHESSGSGLVETLGIGKGSVTLEDLHKAEVIVVMGQNPGTNHPRMLAALEKCKKNGGKIVSVNPIPEAGNNVFVDPQSPVSILKGGTQLTDLYLQIKINADVALLKAVMLCLLEWEEKHPGKVLDSAFISSHTAGFEALEKHLKEQDFDELVGKTGLQKEHVLQLVELIAFKKKIIVCWAMGITQQTNGVENVREIVNLLLLKGSVGIEGGGTCPVRGHSNVQGDRTMGIYEKPSASFLDSLDNAFGITSPRKHGYDVVEAIEAMHSGKVKVFMAMGGNFVSATPDTEYTGEALQNCELTVQISTKLNRSHVVPGQEALILPCLTRSELDVVNGVQQFVTVENSMGIVHSSKGTFHPASDDLLSEPTIVARIGASIIKTQSINWSHLSSHYNHIRDKIEEVIPGFEAFNERVKQTAGFYLPNGARERKFATADAKAQFTLNPVPENIVEKGHFILMTIRTHDQYNTTIYGLDDRYRGIYNERRVVMMNPQDMEEQGLNAMDVVDILGHWKGQVRTAYQFKVVPYDIARGCVATYFPEANVLVPIDHVARISNTPVSKFIEVSFKKCEA